MRIAFFLSLLFAGMFGTSASGQILTPVKWKFEGRTIDAQTAEIIATATIEKKWHVYALKVSDKADAIGPVPTTIKLDASKNYSASGSPTEDKYITHYDPNFDMDLNYHENTAVFKQKIAVNSKTAFKVTGVLEYMACDDERCIFPDPELFEIAILPMGDAGGSITPATEENSTASESPKESTLKWTYRSVQTAKNEYDIIASVQIEKGYHIYSAVKISDGPMPTEFVLSGEGFKTSGGIIEGKTNDHYDPNFGTDIHTFEDYAEFRQHIVVTDPGLTKIQGYVKGMVCLEVCRQFGPNDFVIDLASGVGTSFDPLAGVQVTSLAYDPFKMSSVSLDDPINNCGRAEEHKSLWAIFIFGIIGGLLALLTPCVFPMIPLTVSFFTKGSEGNKGKRRALTYGLFILLIYFILSLPFHLSKNVDPEVLNSIATNVWLNLGFFIIFVVFAISFFGYFEITLPSSLANKVDNASDIGGTIGIFFMALTLAIVSFSCTGPILGTVIGSIYSTDVQGVVNFLGLELSMPAAKVSAAMLGFGLALGLPFGLFAAFPGLLKKLPKSGGWLQDFKVSLGFLELAFALKFLSNSDLVEQWGFIKREVFFAVWILIGILWTLYLLKRFTFKKGYLSTTPVKGFKLGITLLVALFTLRLIPGLLNTEELGKMKFLSGFPPPWTYSFYERKPEFDVLVNDLDAALAKARETNKPVFVDFTGWACVNCRKMEENVWPEPEVKKLLEENFVMVSLYVDEKTELPKDQQFVYQTSDGRKKMIKTEGNKWATLQTETFRNNSQPMYALLTPDGKLLAPIEQNQTDVEAYTGWLQCGLAAFEEWKSNPQALTSEVKP